MIEKFIKSKNFNLVILLASAAVLGLTIYDKMVNIRKNKLEIEKLEANDK